MPQNLTIPECEALGMKFPASLMDNGEYRFRLMGSDGAGYIRTVMPDDKPGEWQNSHYHGGRLLQPGEDKLEVGTIELIVVQKGWVATADLLPDGDRKLSVYTVSEHWISQPGVPHNIYMPAGAVTHCVKYGKDVGNPAKNGSDWYPSPEDFDKWTKSLSEDDIFREVRLTDREITALRG